MPMLAIPGETLLGEQFYRSLIRERGLPRQIMVNAAGRRFVNEALPYNEIGKALHRTDGPVHLIFDEGYRARYPMPGVPGDGPVPDWVGHGRTLGELAARIGASTVALAETVRRWNASCAAGADPEFGRGEGAYQRFCGDPSVTPNPSLGPLDRPPFYAVEVLAGTIGTKGGPVTDTDGQVLRADGSPIPGLYAAGNVAAFWTGDGYPGPGAHAGRGHDDGIPRGAARPRKERTLTCMTVEAGRGLIARCCMAWKSWTCSSATGPKSASGRWRSSSGCTDPRHPAGGHPGRGRVPGAGRGTGPVPAVRAAGRAGRVAAAEGDVRRTALPYLQELVRELGETGHLGVLDGTDAVTIEVVDGWQTVRMHSWVGKRSPAHCSSMGKALLAGLSPADFAARYPGHPLEPRTDRTITDPDVLRSQLAEVRARGYAVDQEELEPHLCCVAGPVFDRTGTVVASISVSGPDSRIGEASIPTIAAAVRRAAAQISARLGAPRDIPDWSSHDLGGLPGPGPDGRPDGRPVLAAGHELTVWNRTAARTQPLVADGARAAATPAEAAAAAEIVITMLADPTALSSVLDGPDGVVAGIRPDGCLVDMSTVGPAAALAARDRLPAGVGFVDAPVMGRWARRPAGSWWCWPAGMWTGWRRSCPSSAR